MRLTVVAKDGFRVSVDVHKSVLGSKSLGKMVGFRIVWRFRTVTMWRCMWKLWC